MEDGCASRSVGILEGGTDEFPIYRASLPTRDASREIVDGDGGGTSRRIRRRKGGGGRRKGGGYDDDDANAPSSSSSSNGGNNAVMRLLDLYNEKRRGGATTLTAADIESYMLGMCNRRVRERGGREGEGRRCRLPPQGRREREGWRYYDRLINLMLVIQFGGPTPGQVRHVDDTAPNLQICTYMLRDCPSTIVYEMDDDGAGREDDDDDDDDGEDDNVPLSSSRRVSDCASLLGYWRCWGSRRRPREPPRARRRCALPRSRCFDEVRGCESRVHVACEVLRR